MLVVLPPVATSSMKLRQYTLRTVIDGHGAAYDFGFRDMVVWLEDGRAKVGDKVTLKDSDEPERQWVVLVAHSDIDSKHLKDHRGFGDSIQGRGSLRD